MRYLTVICLLSLLQGCCWMAKRDCFPACPDPTPTEILPAEKKCQLPPTLTLPAVEQSECGEAKICFDIHNAGLLAQREAAMKEWIRQAQARCR